MPSHAYSVTKGGNGRECCCIMCSECSGLISTDYHKPC